MLEKIGPITFEPLSLQTRKFLKPLIDSTRLEIKTVLGHQEKVNSIDFKANLVFISSGRCASDSQLEDADYVVSHKAKIARPGKEDTTGTETFIVYEGIILKTMIYEEMVFSEEAEREEIGRLRWILRNIRPYYGRK